MSLRDGALRPTYGISKGGAQLIGRWLLLVWGEEYPSPKRRMVRIDDKFQEETYDKGNDVIPHRQAQ
jgi:hypothetical protein